MNTQFSRRLFSISAPTRNICLSLSLRSTPSFNLSQSTTKNRQFSSSSSMSFSVPSTSTSKCIPCKSTADPLTQSEHDLNLAPLSKSDWTISTDSTSGDEIKVLTKTYNFKNWKFAQKFCNQVGESSEANGHHPTLILTWGKVKVEWWTHTVKGVSSNLTSKRTIVINLKNF